MGDYGVKGSTVHRLHAGNRSQPILGCNSLGD